MFLRPVKKLTFTTIMTALLVTLAIAACAPAILGQGVRFKIDFAKLSTYVDDWDNRRDGELLVVTNVPAMGAVTFYKPYGLYTFQPAETNDVGDTFYTSATLAQSVHKYLKKGSYTERIYCTLIQFKDDQEAYRSPFATKVEGFNEDGKLAWTAVGPAPVKLLIRL
jgi:hypothetical protein